MQLQQLSALFIVSRIEGDGLVEFSGIQTDSRQVVPGDLFICLTGLKDDGHHYAEQAIDRGAVALVTRYPLDVTVPMLITGDTRHALAVIANYYYQYPSTKMKLIGVTGTNGKTTTTHLIDMILREQGYMTGLMGTIEMRIQSDHYEVNQTTQESLELQRNLRRMKDAHTQYCIMEVSSHALAMGRVKGCRFRTAVFTNLSQDHLDFHQTMTQYRDAKGLLFSRMGNVFYTARDDQQFVVLNADDPISRHYKQLTAAQVITFGIDQKADVRAHDINISAQGTSFVVDTFQGTCSLQMRLIGKFSVYNALAAIAVALIEAVPLTHVKRTLQMVQGVPGRFELIEAGQTFVTIVDYAHTPDSLENVLMTIRDFAKADVICVFGCGGDRDQSKRPLMGRIAAKYCDQLYITTDNPRFEDPLTIMNDIEQGVLAQGMRQESYSLIIDRQKAIETAIVNARQNDVILIAGKGHETYQDIKGVKTNFDDRIVAQNAIRSFSGDQS